MFTRYSRWDGSQEPFGLDADELMEAMSDDLLDDGDLWRALQRMLRRGAENQQGDRMQGLRDLMEQLRNRRQREPGPLRHVRRCWTTSRSGWRTSSRPSARGSSGGSRKAGRTSRATTSSSNSSPGSSNRVSNRPDNSSPASMQSGEQQSGEGGESGEQQAGQQDLSPEQQAAMQKMLERMADQKRQQLDQLPDDMPGQIRSLQDYDFMDPDARQQFQELLDMLKQQMMQSTFQGMQQAIQNTSPEAMQGMKQMLSDLNQMLRQAAEGGNPDFDGFMQKWGQLFPGAENLEQLVDQLQQQMAQMQSLLDSMSPQQRRQLQDMMNAALQDPELRQELAELAYEPGAALADGRHAPALLVPWRRAGLAPGSDEADGRPPAARPAGAAASRGRGHRRPRRRRRRGAATAARR